MILMTYSYEKVVIGVLLVSITLLILIIAYRKLLAYLGKGNPIKEDYCVLYSLETPFASGEVEIYFTTEKPKAVTIQLLNNDLSFHSIIKEGDFGIGGHISRLDTRKLNDGEYFFCLKTDNQKTMKKMMVKNA
jgi:hypothetical protein